MSHLKHKPFSILDLYSLSVKRYEFPSLYRLVDEAPKFARALIVEEATGYWGVMLDCVCAKRRGLFCVFSGLGIKVVG